MVLGGTSDDIEGMIAVADEVRMEARTTIGRIRDLGVHLVMLTGYNERIARVIDEAVELEEFRAKLLPAKKVRAVERLDSEVDGVVTVGDGVNDAPALAAAMVGVAMGGRRTDAALETADGALMINDL